MPRRNLVLDRRIAVFGELLDERVALAHVEIAPEYRRRIRGGEAVGDEPHQRFWANGRSMLTVMMSTPGSLAASSLKRLVWASQTGVSSEGITLMMRTRLPVSFRATVLSPPSTRLKSGAASPTFSSGPTSVLGLPFITVSMDLPLISPYDVSES